MKKTKRRALYIVAALLGALFVLSCLVGFAACGGGSKDCAHENVTWDETKTVDATCGKDGSKTGTCNDCGETVTETIPATGNHTWDDGEVTTQPTATEKGVRTYTCTVCGATKTEDIAATGTTPEPEEPETSFSVTLSESLSIVQGLTAELTVTITADDASAATIVWTSSDTTVASVTADSSDFAKATVAGNAAGSATITVTVTIGEETVKAECVVTVTAAVATGIELDATSMSVAVGDANTLTATVTMNNSGTYAGSYTWKSSDESVATVSGTGSEATVTALKAGAATISVTDEGKAASASCAVTVSERLAVPDPVNDELDKTAMALGSESFAGYDYTVESTTITSVDEETEVETEEDVYLITGTASAMTEDIVKWYNGGETGAAKKGDSYITLKIFVGIGNTISYTSAGSEEKSYTNTNGEGNFDGDYLFVCERLTGVYADGSQVQTLDGVSYTITDASENVREEVSIIFDITTVAWDGTSYSTSWYTTTKSSEKDEFTIYSAEELAGLANIVNNKTDSNSDGTEMSFASQKVKLGANIDLGSKNWTPIGHQKDETLGVTVTEYFDGDFDGNGYTIYNLDIEPGEGQEHEQIGLFGHVFGGTFENIHIHNAKVVGTKNVGALAGATQAGNGSGGTYGTTCTFSNCTVDGLVDVEGNYQVGGLIGDLTQTTLVNCSVIGDEGSKVTAWDGDSSNEKEYSAGGMIGCAVGDSKDTTSIVTTGDWKWAGLSVSGLEISSPARVGGIAGKYYDECGKLTMEDCTVSDCVLTIVTGSATTKDPTIGALIGVYVAGIFVQDGNAVENVQINYTDENYIGSSSDGTYLLFGGSEPQTGNESYATVSFNSDGATYKIATSGLTATKITTTT